MANPMYGSNKIDGALSVFKDAGYELLVGDKTVLEAESGKVFGLDATAADGAIAVTLPDTTGLQMGANYTFVIIGESTGEYTINCQDKTDTTGDHFVGGCMLGAGTATDNEAAGYAQAVANDSVMTLDQNGGNTGGEAGSVFSVRYLGNDGGRGQWLVSGNIGTADVDATGAAMFTNGS
jgi:hypothetical protein